MERASKALLGVAVPIEFDVTRWPDNFEPTDKPMAVIVWKKMMAALEVAEHEAAHPKPVVPKPHADEKDCEEPSNEWLSTNDRQVQDSYPERYVDDDGQSMFDLLVNLLEEAESKSETAKECSAAVLT